MQRQNWKQIFKSIWKIKPQSPKVKLFIKPKSKNKEAMFKKLRSKKEVQKKNHHPPMLLFIPNITFFKVKKSLASITVRKFKLKLHQLLAIGF
jgi:hypothetical protein